jgi:tryptophan synthase alpha chain
MNRIDEKFRELRKSNRKAFIAYITAGDPDMSTSGRIARALSENGADIIELGIPFSDPLADGPTIQKAVERSLKAGCNVKKTFDLVRSLRKVIDTPLVFMTYYNIVNTYGLAKFSREAKKAGADGIIVPDLPMEESAPLAEASAKEGFHLIMLTSPTTSMARFRKIAAISKGFIYHVSLTGVTGARSSLAGGLEKDLKKLAKATSKPVCAGFGVSTPEQARSVAGSSAGVIIGSAIIKIIEGGLRNKKAIPGKIGKFADSISRAVHGV